MYTEAIPTNPSTTTMVKIKYDCCGKEHTLKWKDADKNFKKNNSKHICRLCWLRLHNPAKNAETKEKTKQTNLERYGSTTALNTQENIEKRLDKMFGTQEAIDARTEKTKQTNLEKFGVEHAAQAEICKEKTRETFREKYGVDHPLQNPEVLAKVQATNLERYGSICSLNDPAVKAKALRSLLEHYGVEYYNQLPEMRDYLRENCREWLKESWANPWAKGIERPIAWIEKQRKTVDELIRKGEWKSGHKNTWRGYYSASKCKREISFFRSGFELMYHYHLDNNDLVEWYDYESFGIHYKKIDGTEGTYYPDFVVKFFNDPILHIKEVKANYLHDSEETKLKYLTAIEYVSKFENMDFEVLLKEEIYALKVDFEELIKDKRVIILHNPRLNKVGD